MGGIGTLAEQSLHASLKHYYGRPGDRYEEPVEGFVVDIVRKVPDKPDLLIEIQTGSFGAMRRKLAHLLAGHRVLLVHPIAAEKWIVRVSAQGELLARRKSPRRGRVEDVYRELVRLPEIILHPNLALEAVLVQEEQILVDDGAGSWRRRRWSVADRRLLGVLETVRFTDAGDLAARLPPDLPAVFTSRDLAAALGCALPLAQKMTYCLVRMAVLQDVGKAGRSKLYTQTG